MNKKRFSKLGRALQHRVPRAEATDDLGWWRRLHWTQWTSAEPSRPPCCRWQRFVRPQPICLGWPAVAPASFSGPQYCGYAANASIFTFGHHSMPGGGQGPHAPTPGPTFPTPAGGGLHVREASCLGWNPHGSIQINTPATGGGLIISGSGGVSNAHVDVSGQVNVEGGHVAGGIKIDIH
jgi:hypothetical protein